MLGCDLTYACSWCRLKLREMLMPEVVNQSASLESQNGKGRKVKAEVPNRTGSPKTWKVAPDIFPRDLSGSAQQIAQEVGSPGCSQDGVICRAIDQRPPKSPLHQNEEAPQTTCNHACHLDTFWPAFETLYIAQDGACAIYA